MMHSFLYKQNHPWALGAPENVIFVNFVSPSHLPFEDVLVVDEPGGEALDGVLVELGQLLAEQEGGLAVLSHLMRWEDTGRISEMSSSTQYLAQE